MMKFTFSAVLLVLGSSLILSGCATFSGAEHSENVAKLTPGMTESQVLNLLGTPDSVYRKGDQSKWVYEFRKKESPKRNLAVEFKGKQLVRLGEMSGREIAAAEEIREPGVCTKITNPREIRVEPLCAH
jgi:outer membrane protein assembly factor BamE (lipoprotein component of BamABCDE complex)